MRNKIIFFCFAIVFATAGVYCTFKAVTDYWAYWFVVALSIPLTYIMLTPKYTNKWF